MKCTVTDHIPFSQTYNFRDLLDGGNCQAYAILFFTYLSALQLKNPSSPIDYSYLVAVLKNYNHTEIHALNENQSNYYEYARNCQEIKEMLDREYAILNVNHQFPGWHNQLYEFACMILCHREHFNDIGPTFYFLTIRDSKKLNFNDNTVISHIVGFYLASPNEIHFFDANRGLYVLSLPTDINEVELKEDLLNLVIPNYPILKYFIPIFVKDSPTLQFSFGWTQKNHALNEEGKVIRALLQNIIDEPDNYLQPDNLMLNNRWKQIRAFLDRYATLMQIIEKQRAHHRSQSVIQYIQSYLPFTSLWGKATTFDTEQKSVRSTADAAQKSRL